MSKISMLVAILLLALVIEHYSTVSAKPASLQHNLRGKLEKLSLREILTFKRKEF